MSNVYTTRQLAMMLDALDRPSSFLLDTFFPTVLQFETEMIDFDIIDEQKKLAPFVSPMVEAKPMKDRGFKTNSFKPAYVKPKTAVDPTRPMKRRPGEQYAGTMTPAMRRDAAIIDLMEDHRRMIIRRKEWMAAQALRTGKVIVEGEDYPAQEVDFGRDAELTVALTGGDRWGEVGVKVMDTIEAWATLVQDKSGAVSTDVVMDPETWKRARVDEDFLKMLDNRRQTDGNVQLGPIAVGGEGNKARYVGNVGDFDFWVYNDSYVDDAGDPQKFLAPNQLLLGGGDIQGVQAQGAVHDQKFGYAALEFAPKIIEIQDPAVEQVLTQSAPLVVPSRVNATFAATVWNPA